MRENSELELRRRPTNVQARARREWVCMYARERRCVGSGGGVQDVRSRYSYIRAWGARSDLRDGTVPSTSTTQDDSVATQTGQPIYADIEVDRASRPSRPTANRPRLDGQRKRSAAESATGRRERACGHPGRRRDTRRQSDVFCSKTADAWRRWLRNTSRYARGLGRRRTAKRGYAS